MGVTSIRFNKQEEQVLKYLKEYFHCDSSSLLKKSMFELYEDIKDKEIIDNFEKDEEDGKVTFTTFDSLMDEN
jgi:hypothetical protein